MSSYFAHAPAEYFDLLGIRTYTYRPDEDGTYQFIHAFFTEKDQLQASMSILSSKLANDGVLWISVPKDDVNLDKNSIVSSAENNYLTISKETEFSNWSAYQFVVA